MRRLKVRRLLLGIPLLVAAIATGLLGWRWGLGSLAQWQAAQSFERLHARADLPPADAAALLAAARSNLDRAIRLRGVHPDQLDLAGQLTFWEALNLASFGDARSALLAEAVEYYREAIARRPTWPYFWANLAVAKAERGVFDVEFRRALRRAVETGPWERTVQTQLIRVDFVEQQRLDRRSRDLIDKVIERALKIQPGEVLRLADEFGQMPRVCGLADDPRWEARCAPYRPAGQKS